MVLRPRTRPKPKPRVGKPAQDAALHFLARPKQYPLTEAQRADLVQVVEGFTSPHDRDAARRGIEWKPRRLSQPAAVLRIARATAWWSSPGRHPLMHARGRPRPANGMLLADHGQRPRFQRLLSLSAGFCLGRCLAPLCCRSRSWQPASFPAVRQPANAFRSTASPAGLFSMRCARWRPQQRV
jgi:hypothetical protein